MHPDSAGNECAIFDIAEINKWEAFAGTVSERCGKYWRSVLILDNLDELMETEESRELWEVIKKVFKY